MGHSRSLPLRLKWMGAILFGLAIAGPASAQVQVRIEFGRPQAYGFSNNYPWFNDVPQYQGDQSFQYFLAYHPDIARALSRNPGLLYNAAWRSDNPALEDYLDSHPYVWEALNNANWATGPAQTRWGYYDNQRQWRDAYWWHQNDPSWFYDNHQDWSSLDSRWLIQDGAYDQQRRWHYGEWWYNQNPGWVTTNHPMWLSQNQNWSTPSVQQAYRQRHAMVALNQQQLQQNQQQQTLNHRQANLQQQQRQMNRQQNLQSEQRAINPRQANTQQQQNMRQDNHRQQQANRQQHQQNQQRMTNQHQANAQQQQNARQQNQRQQQANHQQARPQQPQANRQQSRPQPQASRQQARPAYRQASRQKAQPAQVARANKR
jgi:hypothetical protein